MPWLSRIYSYFKESGFNIDFDEEKILEKYKNSTDNYIKESILKILVIQNPDRAILESNLFLTDNNSIPKI